MQTLGIVALSILAGLFLALMLLGLGILLWNSVQVKRGLAEMREREASIHVQTAALFEKYQAEILRISGEYVAKQKSELDAARSGFSGIRAEMKTLLEEHNRRTLSAIEKINADALQAAVKRNVDACAKLEKAVGLFQNWLMSAAAQPNTEYGPDEYAPKETSFGTPVSEYSVGPVAALDQQAEQEEAAQVETES